MSYSVLWKRDGEEHTAECERRDTADNIVQAIAGFYSGDSVPIELYELGPQGYALIQTYTS